MDALRKTLLAEGGRDGFDSYRVPGLAVTAAGTLRGRRNTASRPPAARAG